MKRALLIGIVVAQALVLSARANPVNGDLFYTRYADAPNVKSVQFSYDGVSNFSFTLPPTVIGTTPGADGIVGNPQNSNLLIVGGQGNDISTINRTTGAVTTYFSPTTAFHLAVADSTTLLASGIPGGLARHAILAGGGLGAGSMISLSGNDLSITSIIATPTGFYYTTSGSGGNGSFGSIVFNTSVGSATSAVTTRLFSGVASAHGGAYDPFTGDVMLFGSSRVGQYDIGTGSLVERNFSGLQFDQGAVDGAGHMFVASNTGHLLFMDYSATANITAAGNFTATPFLDTYLDDVAPLIGAGGTAQTPDGGSTIALVGAAFAALAAVQRRRRSDSVKLR